MSPLEAFKGTITSLPFEFCDVETFTKIAMPFGNDAIVAINEDGNDWFSTNFSFDTCAAGTARFIAGFFLLPIFATIGAIYHSGSGLAKLGIHLYDYAQTEAADHYGNLYREYFIGDIQRLIISVYNLAIALLSPVVALLYAVNGEQLIEKHDKFHGTELSGNASISYQWAEKIVNIWMPRNENANA